MFNIQADFGSSTLNSVCPTLKVVCNFDMFMIFIILSFLFFQLVMLSLMFVQHVCIFDYFQRKRKG